MRAQCHTCTHTSIYYKIFKYTKISVTRLPINHDYQCINLYTPNLLKHLLLNTIFNITLLSYSLSILVTPPPSFEFSHILHFLCVISTPLFQLCTFLQILYRFSHVRRLNLVSLFFLIKRSFRN